MSWDWTNTATADSIFLLVSVWHHGCKSDLQGPGSDDPRSGGDDWWVALGLLFSGLCGTVVQNIPQVDNVQRWPQMHQK